MTKDEIIEDFNRAIQKLEDVIENDLSIDEQEFYSAKAGTMQVLAMREINNAINHLSIAVRCERETH